MEKTQLFQQLTWEQYQDSNNRNGKIIHILDRDIFYIENNGIYIEYTKQIGYSPTDDTNIRDYSKLIGGLYVFGTSLYYKPQNGSLIKITTGDSGSSFDPTKYYTKTAIDNFFQKTVIIADSRPSTARVVVDKNTTEYTVAIKSGIINVAKNGTAVKISIDEVTTDMITQGKNEITIDGNKNIDNNI